MRRAATRSCVMPSRKVLQPWGWPSFGLSVIMKHRDLRPAARARRAFESRAGGLQALKTFEACMPQFAGRRYSAVGDLCTQVRRHPTRRRRPSSPAIGHRAVAILSKRSRRAVATRSLKPVPTAPA